MKPTFLYLKQKPQNGVAIAAVPHKVICDFGKNPKNNASNKHVFV